MKMREMCAADRPREKMMERGPGGLGNAELLAVLLRTGNREESAVELAQKLLKMADGSLVRLFGWNAAKLCSMPGIGPYKAAGVLAAFELGRRFLQEGDGFAGGGFGAEAVEYHEGDFSPADDVPRGAADAQVLHGHDVVALRFGDDGDLCLRLRHAAVRRLRIPVHGG